MVSKNEPTPPVNVSLSYLLLRNAFKTKIKGLNSGNFF